MVVKQISKRKYVQKSKKVVKQSVKQISEAIHEQTSQCSVKQFSINEGNEKPEVTMVELRRLELLTPYMQSRCSPN